MDTSHVLPVLGIIIFIGLYIALNVGVIYFAVTLFPSPKKTQKINQEWLEWKRKIKRQQRLEAEAEERARKKEAGDG